MSLYSVPHMCIWCMLNINAVWQGPFFSSFVSENVMKKMYNVCPPQSRRDFQEVEFILTMSHVFSALFPCVAEVAVVTAHCFVWFSILSSVEVR